MSWGDSYRASWLLGTGPNHLQIPPLRTPLPLVIAFRNSKQIKCVLPERVGILFLLTYSRWTAMFRRRKITLKLTQKRNGEGKRNCSYKSNCFYNTVFLEFVSCTVCSIKPLTNGMDTSVKRTKLSQLSTPQSGDHGLYD